MALEGARLWRARARARLPRVPDARSGSRQATSAGPLARLRALMRREGV